ncbi:MBL fold metallo-hydrolase [Pseudorhodobacter sp. W20_MBD10_FR17]|uniref:MBL fold metallo-hydrolase n=1 Tax=Pseudorhodobacter sp. W20_MBD10_FR17 TaxID=3240266 RepID=UPI003F9670E5
MTNVVKISTGAGILTVLQDGTDCLPMAMFLNVRQPAAENVTIPINAFLYQTAGRNVLIDSGLGPSSDAGHLQQLLAAANVSPAQIDTVFCTHLHPDHIGGLLDDGACVFANAQLYLHREEVAFWGADALYAAAPAPFKAVIDGARAVLAGYASRIVLFEDGAEIAPEAFVMHLPGHTPGHSGLQLGPVGHAQVMLWADIVHASTLQLAQVDVGVVFDADPGQAQATRRAILQRVADSDILLAGGHLPGIGRIERTAEGYRFAPLPQN